MIREHIEELDALSTVWAWWPSAGEPPLGWFLASVAEKTPETAETVTVGDAAAFWRRRVHQHDSQRSENTND